MSYTVAIGIFNRVNASFPKQKLGVSKDFIGPVKANLRSLFYYATEFYVYKLLVLILLITGNMKFQ